MTSGGTIQGADVHGPPPLSVWSARSVPGAGSARQVVRVPERRRSEPAQTEPGV